MQEEEDKVQGAGVWSVWGRNYVILGAHTLDYFYQASLRSN